MWSTINIGIVKETQQHENNTQNHCILYIRTRKLWFSELIHVMYDCWSVSLVSWTANQPACEHPMWYICVLHTVLLECDDMIIIRKCFFSIVFFSLLFPLFTLCLSLFICYCRPASLSFWIYVVCVEKCLISFIKRNKEARIKEWII